MPTSKSSWKTHIFGLERLFASRGPLTTENSTIIDRALLEYFRPIMILGSFFSRMPSLMSKLEWTATTKPQDVMKRPDLFRTATATPDLSFLMWLLSQLPELLLERDKCLRLEKTKKASRASRNNIRSKKMELQHELDAWKTKWDIEHSGDVSEIFPTAGADPTQVPPWKTVFTFTSIEIANAFVMYQTVMSLLSGVALSMLRIGPRPQSSFFTPFDDLEFDELQSVTDMEDSTISICRSVDYYQHPTQVAQGQRDFLLLFPMHVARRALKQMDRVSEFVWLASAFETVQSKSTMGMWADIDISDNSGAFDEGLFR